MTQRGWASTDVVAVPIGLSLVVLLVVGVGYPSLVESGVSPGAYLVAIVVAGSLCTTALGIAALRTAGRLRASWAAIAATAALWTASAFIALRGGDDLLAWGVLRPASGLTGALALLMAPGVRRTAREWGVVLLDGWLVSGSVFLVGWLALMNTGSHGAAGAPLGRPALLWIPVDLLFVSVVSGLAMRSERTTRVPVLMMVLVSLLSVTGDSTWALAQVPHFAVVQWIILMAALAASTVSTRLDLWQAAAPERAHPQLVRWPQVAVVPGLAAAVSGPGGPVVAAVAISVILAMVAQILLVARQNGELWAALASQAARLDLVLRESRDAIVQVDRQGAVEFANDAVTDVLGVSPQALLGRAFADGVHPGDRATFLSQLAELSDRATAIRVVCRFCRPDGTARHVEATVSPRLGTSGYTLLARDVTERSRREAELRLLASSDALTGLLNRHAFLALLDERLAAGAAAVLFLDLDGFKTVNDRHGHAAGDRLLVEAADALRDVLGVQDVAARLGGDEFAVLVAEPSAARALAVRVTERLRRLPSDSTGATTASVGVAVGAGVDGDALLADADLAMYRAKARGGGRHAVYDPIMRTAAPHPVTA